MLVDISDQLNQVDIFRLDRVPYSRPDTVIQALTVSEVIVSHLDTDNVKLALNIGAGWFGHIPYSAIGIFGLEFGNRIYLVYGIPISDMYTGLYMSMRSNTAEYNPVIGYWIDADELVDPLITTIKDPRNLVRAILEDVYNRSRVPAAK